MGDDAFQNITLGDLLSNQAAVFPDHPFLRLEDRVWTYAQVDRHASALAAGLHGVGLQAGDRLAVMLPNVPEYIITLFASARAGLILVPINIRRHRSEVRDRLAKTGPKGIVTFSDPDNYWEVDHLAMAREMRSEIEPLDVLVAVGSAHPKTLSWEDLAATTAPPPDTLVDPKDPAAVLHTLGSSGNPRGAVLAHAGLVRNAADVARILHATSEDIFLGAVPFTNAFGLTPTILACTAAGAQIVCLPHFTPGKTLALVESAGVTVHHGVPTMFALELNHADFHPSRCASLRTGIMSGAPCPPDLVKRVREQMGCDILLAYGLTEASPSVTMTRFRDGPVTATQTVGRPHRGVGLKVVDPEGVSLPDGEEGELCVRGYNVMLGYWDNPADTAQVLDSEGWLRTGDLAVIDPDGPVRIVGRKDNIINRGGFKVHPATVEMVLRSHPGVKDAAVVGVPDLIFGELSYACVVQDPTVSLKAEDLLTYVAEHLAHYAVPDRVLFFNALPRRGSGPVDKEYLNNRVRIRGRSWKFGANVDTDAIIPARRCNTSDPHELALYCMEDADPTFVSRMQRGDLIVADTNFGCGSSREVAPLSIKAAGVSAVIAKSFARIFFRNAINIGLPILESTEAAERIRAGDEVEVEPATGAIRNLTRHETYQAEPFPDFLQRIIDRGGLLSYVEERLATGPSGDSL